MASWAVPHLNAGSKPEPEQDDPLIGGLIEWLNTAWEAPDPSAQGVLSPLPVFSLTFNHALYEQIRVASLEYNPLNSLV